MRVLITGAAGYIGRALTRFLLNQGCQVIGLVRGEQGSTLDPRVEQRRWYPCQRHPLREMPVVDVVVHLASPSLAECDRAPSTSCRAHLNATRYLLAQALPRHKFIYLSSCSVFGYQPTPVDETSPPAPIHPYGMMKLAAEQEVLGHSHRYPAVVVRLGTLYGVGPIVRSDLLLNRLVRDALAGEPLRLDGPELWRCFIHLDDAVLALWQIIQLAPTEPREMLCVGDPSMVMTLQQAGDAVASVVPGTRIRFFPPGTDRRSYQVRLARMRYRYGIQPSVPLSTGLAVLVEYFKQQGASG